MRETGEHWLAVGRMSNAARTEIQGLGIMGRETSDLERMVCFPLIRDRFLLFTLVASCHLVAHPVGILALGKQFFHPAPHNCTVLSSLAEAMRVPSGDHATAHTQLV